MVLADLLASSSVLGFIRYLMVIVTLQQIINVRISFLKEQINVVNKPEVNKTFQIQIDTIRSIDNYCIEKVEAIIKQKKTILKNINDLL